MPDQTDNALKRLLKLTEDFIQSALRFSPRLPSSLDPPQGLADLEARVPALPPSDKLT